jgi:hypothetical protein
MLTHCKLKEMTTHVACECSHIIACGLKNKVAVLIYNTCIFLDYTQCVQVLLGLCSLNTQDINYFQNFTLFIQNSIPLNQYIAGID